LVTLQSHELLFKIRILISLKFNLFSFSSPSKAGLALNEWNALIAKQASTIYMTSASCFAITSIDLYLYINNDDDFNLLISTNNVCMTSHVLVEAVSSKQ
jgi:hypothetical protein